MQPGQLPPREIKDLDHGNHVRSRLLAGVEQIYEAVSSTYGPSGNNVLLELPYGDPTLTRDGVTVAKRVFLSDRVENMAARVIAQASDKTNKTAGDGTTATVVLARNVLTAAHQQVGAGINAMKLKRQIDDDARLVIDWLKSNSSPAADHLVEVATVSAGDPAIGQLIAETVREVGANGGITIREQTYPTIDVERVNGYHFDKGFFALNQQIELAGPHILVSQKRLMTNTDILPILNHVASDQNNKKLVIIGEVAGDAMQTALANAVGGKYELIILQPPAYGDEARLFMEDIATYVGAKPLLEGMSTASIGAEFFGTAERVQASQQRGIIFGGGGAGDDIADRAAELMKQIEDEHNPHRKDVLEGRYAKLVGKIAIVNVGGSTPTEMEELRFRVEDAIEATKSAMADGVLPGGATMLVHAATIPGVSALFAGALRETFKKLMSNAAENSEKRLGQVEDAKIGMGFNLRAMTDKPLDLGKAGIWDATRSIVQTVENAASAAGALLTTNATVSIHDEEKPRA
jgi:chaperonin GroEL